MKVQLWAFWYYLAQGEWSYLVHLCHRKTVWNNYSLNLSEFVPIALVGLSQVAPPLLMIFNSSHFQLLHSRTLLLARCCHPPPKLQLRTQLNKSMRLSMTLRQTRTRTSKRRAIRNTCMILPSRETHWAQIF